MLISIHAAKGPQLDWLVAKALGAYDLQLVPTYETNTAWQYSVKDEEEPGRVDKVYLSDTQYSTDWAQGGPIIDLENIALYPHGDGTYEAEVFLNPKRGAGPTPLIAAMRCYVTSKLGDEIEIPEELT